MKKIIALFTVLAFVFNMAIAQEAKKSKAEGAKKEAKAEKAPKAEKEAKAPKAEESKAAPAGTAAEPKLKKDGTPDMRYKENKEGAKKEEPKGPTKKDGTPDKRFKENKDAKK